MKLNMMDFIQIEKVLINKHYKVLNNIMDKKS